MGVKYLWSIIRSAGTSDIPKNKRLAVDTSIWLYYYKNVPLDVFIYNTIKRILKLFYNKNIPIFIFDTGTPFQKRKAIEDRKSREVINLAKKFIQNVTCKICNKSYRECEHATIENHEEIEKGNEAITARISEKRSENWGITYDDEMKILDEAEFESMSKLQKLKALVKLRQKRKLPSNIKAEDGIDFSISQINNVRKRNRVNELIDKLEDRNDRRIMSDCSKSYTFEAKIEEDKEGSEELDIMQIFDSDIKIEVSEESSKTPCEDDFIDENIFMSSSDSDYDNDQSFDCDILEYTQGNNLDNIEESYESKIISESTDDTIEHQTEINVQNNNMLKDKTQNDEANDIQSLTSSNNINPVTDIKETMHDLETVHRNESIDNIKNQNNLDDNKGKVDIPTYNSKIDTNNNLESADIKIKKYISITENDMSEDLRSLGNTIKEIFNSFDIQYMHAPMEADSQCAYLNSKGLVDGIISEDNDMFLYGGKVVYKNYFKKNAKVIKYDINKVRAIVTPSDMIKLGYYLGSDYCEGQVGIGPKKVMQMLSQEIDNDEFDNIKKLYTNPYVHEMESIKWKNVNYRKARSYIFSASLPSELKEELLHYIEKLQQLSSTTDNTR